MADVFTQCAPLRKAIHFYYISAMKANIDSAQLVFRCAATDTDTDCFTADDFCAQIEQIYLFSSNQSYTDVRVPAIQITPPPTYIRFLNLQSTRSQIGATVLYMQCSESAASII